MKIIWVDNNKRTTFYDSILKFNKKGGFGFSGRKQGLEILPITTETAPACDLKAPDVAR